MTISELKRTTWARRFKRTAPSSFARALEYAAEPGLQVSIELRKDLSEDKPLWAIVVVEPRSGDDDFWMDAFREKDNAVALCEAMGWVYEVGA